jgi:hypothetical protein
MKKLFALMVLLCSVVMVGFSQVGDWPAAPGAGYTYFGNTAVNQTQVGNYAMLQDNTGRTYLNSPLDIRFRLGNVESMVLTNGGFGVGTSSPAAPLHVAGTGQGSHLTIETNSNGEGDLTWVQGGGTRAAFQVNQFSGDFEAWVSGSIWQRWLQVNRNNGNVGINTTPSYKFHIKNPDLQLVLQTDGTGNNRGIIAFGDAAGVLQGSVGLFGSDGSIRIGDAMDYRIVVKQGGNVGIGTYDPAGKTHINVSSANTNYSALTTSDISLAISNSNATNGNLNIVSFLDAAGWGVAHIGATVPSQSGHTGKLFFSTRPSGSAPVQRMVIDENGKVGIGSLNPSELLTVNGKIYGKQVKVDLSVPGPDYVFEESYALPTLDEVKSYIDENKHLPEIPSAKEMQAHGINVGEMNMLLLKKIEELTLYAIEQNKKINSLAEENKKNGAMIEKLEAEMQSRK